MSKMTHYQILVAIVEEGSVTQAAEKLHLSPAAVSKQLVQLEKNLQVQLFHRSHKRLDITDAGKRFYPKCKKILLSISQAEEELLADRDTVSGTISITLSKALCRSKIFNILSRFSDKHPLIKYDIQFSDHLEDLHEKSIDFAFRLGKLNDNSHVVATPLIKTQLLACATPQYLEKHGTPKSFSDLGGAKLILPSPLSASEDLRNFLNRKRFSIRDDVSHTTNDIEGVHQLVGANLGIGMMLDISVQQEIDSGEFISVLSDSHLPQKSLYLLSKKTSWQNKTQRAFKDHIKSSFKNCST